MLISDWSSDVCSSDLQVRKKAAPALITMVARTVAVVLVPPWLGAFPTFVPGRLRHGGFGALDDLVELPAIEPHPAALRAEVDFDALPLGDRPRDLANGDEHADRKSIRWGKSVRMRM